MNQQPELNLYIAGHTISSQRAINNLHRICNDELAGCCKMTVIDIAQKPQLARDEQIIATPTLIKVNPPPSRRVIGDLSDKEKVLLGLHINPESQIQNKDIHISKT